MVKNSRKSSQNSSGEVKTKNNDVIELNNKKEEKKLSKKTPTQLTKMDIYNEMLNNQISNIPRKWKLTESDINRICQYIDDSIFSDDINKCCIWKGYITNVNNSNKGTYVNFYFNKKKMALHRLLYANFVSSLKSDEYIKFKCKNKGTCCNITHYEKYTYSSSTKKPNKKVEKDQYTMELRFGEVDIFLL